MTRLEEIDHQAEELMTREQWAAAVSLIDQVLPDERTARMHWHHGWALSKLEKFEPAAQSLQLCVAREPMNPIAHWALGVVLREHGDLRGAEHHLLTALSLRDSGLARLNLAVLYMDEGRLDDAERVHLDGLELKPNDRERVERYANFLSDCGRDAEAERQYARAATLPARRRKAV